MVKICKIKDVLDIVFGVGRTPGSQDVYMSSADIWIVRTAKANWKLEIRDLNKN
jgi:hypothetical protein